MAKQIEFRLDGTDYIELGTNALSRGEHEKAVGYFKTACKLADDSASYTALGCAYADMHAIEQSNAALYTAMSRAKTEDDETPALWQLCSNALEEGDTDAAAYYLRYLGEDDSALLAAADSDGKPMFRMAKKAENEFFESRLYYVNEALAENDTTAALKHLEDLERACGEEGIPEQYRDIVHKMKSLCLFAKGDFDKVVALSEQMVREDPSLDNKATLATAYSVQERDEEADAVLDEIMAADIGAETAVKVLPILVAKQRDEDILRAAEIIGSRSSHFKPFSEMYRSEALYNLGKRKEAMRVMGVLANIFGQLSPPGYYMKLYRTEPEKVPYGHEWPHIATVEYVDRVKRVCGTDDLRKLCDALAYDADFNEAVRWVLWYAPDFVACPTLMALSRVRKRSVEKLFRERLIGADLSFDAMEIILDYLLGGGISMEFDIVTQNRFKPVDLILPRMFRALPKHLYNAVYRAACDIVYTDEDPSTYLERLATIINDMTSSNADGELVWRCRNGRKISLLRSEETMIGVLLARVYFDDPDPDDDAMARYDLNERTYYRYKRIFFGDDESYEDQD